MKFCLFLILSTQGSDALHVHKSRAGEQDFSGCSCIWASTVKCKPEFDDGSECMTICCAFFSKAMSSFGGTQQQAQAQDTTPPEEKEERLHCDCSWVIGNRGQCGDNKQGDGSPCGVQCCQDAPDLIKSKLSGFADDIKDKLGGMFGNGPSIKITIPN
eukprot:gnl/MRDRNA2_/MRDRNA2_69308_c0_seq1.p1 gnl/MRDRNA2_/MRDRNA2_69308_c0~~gnl/MRDRNA2_/MRDRNA2_69308_c0_seq1.p1  ORF type:complete len:158 (+),score=33.36 gnl/MRDRNA2_/MRDRNA2_69308_c0_seq1:111-584(+)